jgi:SpoVK/Ycf46/Vps4 family AAA+-type ATPase
MKTTLLTSLDTIQSEWDVIFVAATNRKSALDPALLRRLDIQLYMGNPTTEDQTEFFSKYVKLSKEEISPFISECPKWTLCDLKNFAKYCTRHYLIGKQLADDKMDVSVEELYAFREQYMQLKYSNDDTPSPFM